MATEPTYFGDLVCDGEDGHFPSFLCYNNNVEDDKVLLGLLSDADFAEELQFQEALRASLITAEMSSIVLLSSSSSVTMGELPFPARSNDQPPLDVKERAESSVSFCEICLERMEGDHLVKNHDSAQAFCFNCSKIMELSKEEYFSEGLSIQSNSENYSAESSTSTATNNPNVHVDIDGESVAYERKDECGAEKLEEGAQTPDHEAPRCKDVTRSDNPVTLVDGGNEDQNSTSTGSKKMASNSESLSPAAVGRICTMQPSIRSAADDEHQQQALAHDIVNIVDAADANGNSDFHMSPNGRILEKFFMKFEKLTTEKINEPSRLWHCPACVGGSRAIKSFQGLQAFISHAKTRAGCKRGGPHRELMQLMEEKLLVKETSSTVPACEMLGSSKLKCEMRSDREMVVDGIRKMYEDNQQLLCLKNRVAQKQMHPKDAEESFEAIWARFNHAMQEIQVLRDRINLQHEQHLEEMNCQEQFFKYQMRSILEARSEKEEYSAITRNEGEEGYESAHLSGIIPSNTQGNNEQTAQSKKNKGKEKEIVETDDEPGRSSSSWSLSISQLEPGNCAD